MYIAVYFYSKYNSGLRGGLIGPPTLSFAKKVLSQSSIPGSEMPVNVRMIEHVEPKRKKYNILESTSKNIGIGLAVFMLLVPPTALFILLYIIFGDSTAVHIFWLFTFSLSAFISINFSTTVLRFLYSRFGTGQLNALLSVKGYLALQAICYVFLLIRFKIYSLPTPL
jgi:hypothetical protein